MKRLLYAIVSKEDSRIFTSLRGNSNDAWGKAEELQKDHKEELTVYGGWDNKFQMERWFKSKNFPH